MGLNDPITFILYW